jgi:hypothetical protein
MDHEGRLRVICHSDNDIDVELTILDLCPEYEANQCVAMLRKLNRLVSDWIMMSNDKTFCSNEEALHQFIMFILRHPTLLHRSIRAVYLATAIKELVDTLNIIELFDQRMIISHGVGHQSSVEQFRIGMDLIDDVINHHGVISGVKVQTMGAFPRYRNEDFLPVANFVYYLSRDLSWSFNRILTHDMSLISSTDVLKEHYVEMASREKLHLSPDVDGWLAKIAVRVLNSESQTARCGT